MREKVEPEYEAIAGCQHSTKHVRPVLSTDAMMQRPTGILAEEVADLSPLRLPTKTLEAG